MRINLFYGTVYDADNLSTNEVRCYTKTTFVYFAIVDLVCNYRSILLSRFI